jgi:Tfp pilus assembly protein PilF
MLTIQSAMQVAISYQTRSMIAQAEAIYRSILEEDPTHPDALHLLGVVYYQRGDPSSGIPYIERALLSNKTYEGFHNSLGFHTLGVSN